MVPRGGIEPPTRGFSEVTKFFPNLSFQQVPRRAFLRDVVLIVLKDDLDNVAAFEMMSETSAGSQRQAVLLFMEGASETVGERLEKKGQHGSLTGNDGGLH